jgi:hypothetical protein
MRSPFNGPSLLGSKIGGNEAPDCAGQVRRAGDHRAVSGS